MSLSPLEELGGVAIALNRILDDGEWHSSSELASQLKGIKGGSRAQIQRTIAKLKIVGKDMGFVIESNRRRGYKKTSA